MIFALGGSYPAYPDHLGAHGRVYVAWRAGDFPKKNPPRIAPGGLSSAQFGTMGKL
jgi:hypothetical protein